MLFGPRFLIGRQYNSGPEVSILSVCLFVKYTYTARETFGPTPLKRQEILLSCDRYQDNKLSFVINLFFLNLIKHTCYYELFKNRIKERNLNGEKYFVENFYFKMFDMLIWSFMLLN